MTKVVTPEFRVSFPNLFEAKTNQLSGREEFSVVALFAKDADLTALKDAANAALEKKFGKDKSMWPKNLKTPFRDQGDKAKNVDGKMVLPPGHEDGAVFMNFKASQKPGLVDQKVQDIIDRAEFYAGCYARASVKAYAYDQAGNKGVAFGLGNVQKMKDGDPLGGRTKPEHDFGPVASADNSSATDLFS